MTTPRIRIRTRTALTLLAIGIAAIGVQLSPYPPLPILVAFWAGLVVGRAHLLDIE